MNHQLTFADSEFNGKRRKTALLPKSMQLEWN